MFGQAKEGLSKAGSTVALGAKDLKEHLIKQEFTKSIMGFFSGKKKEEEGKLDTTPVDRSESYKED